MQQTRAATVTIHLPLALRAEAPAPTLDVAASTVAEALAALGARHPALGRHVFDETGALRQHVNVFLNRDDVRTLGGLRSPVRDGDEIHVVPSIAGG